ncbi:MAG: type II toxin-antitoxin system Phd/YefM family antitoxin [Dehalococcoidia bacterium]|nr:type II toxin-antitoxin system Phd/YefM family antitoxin [Dehalococcoidia bacterium]MDD5493835.1 type II toxin-antitoxin system Phd/YefM family antitoxin [Dehalococcoidia bacterium]
MSTKIITVTELKTRLGRLIDELEEEGTPMYVTQHGKPKAVFTPYDKYEALVQKIEDLQDLLAMREALSAPENESVTLYEYERGRKS